MSAIIVCSASVIRSRSSLRNMGNAGTYTLSLTNPQKRNRMVLDPTNGVAKGDMLHRVWDEFYYRVDVCRVTEGFTQLTQ
jgi:hypothetical protein